MHLLGRRLAVKLVGMVAASNIRIPCAKNIGLRVSNGVAMRGRNLRQPRLKAIECHQEFSVALVQYIDVVLPVDEVEKDREEL